jgi:uncharacterized protein (DUF736 family)
MQIGSFQKTGDALKGTIRTLTLSAEVTFMPIYGSRGSLSPSHIILTNGIEVGAAWPKVPGDLNNLKVRIDDPSFPAPILGVLIPAGEGEFVLIWKRPAWRG